MHFVVRMNRAGDTDRKWEENSQWAARGLKIQISIWDFFEMLLDLFTQSFVIKRWYYEVYGSPM